MTIYDVCNECLYRMTHHFRDNDDYQFYKYMSILKQIVNENLIIPKEAFSPKITGLQDDSNFNDLVVKKANVTFETEFYFDKKFHSGLDLDEMCKEEFIKKIKCDISAKAEKHWCEVDKDE